MVLVLGFVAVETAKSSESSECTFDRMQINPQSVIDLCSDSIKADNLSAAQRAQLLFVRARAFARTKRTAEAREDYDEALKLTPGDDEIYVSRSNTFFKVGQPRQALADLDRALKLNPKNARALRAVGTFFLDIQQPDQALDYLTQALDADPIEPYALLFRSKTYARQRRLDDSLRDAGALVAIPPETINKLGYVDSLGVLHDFHVKALEHRAEIYAASGRADLAEQDLDAAVAYKRSSEALLARGDFRRLHERKAEALDDMAEAARLGPDDSEIQFNRGLLLIDLRRPGEALEAFDHAIKIRPQWGDAHFLKARVLRELDQTGEAFFELERAMMIDPRLVGRTVPALRASGYWTAAADPTSITPALRDALRACMLDKTCN